MAKELPYFKFYTNEWLAGNITLLDMATQGVFINVCVLFWSRDCDLTYQNCIERFKKKDRKIIENLIKTGIIKTKNGNISILFLEKQKESQQNLSKTNKKNVEKRYKTEENKAFHSTTVDPVVYNIEEIRGEEIRGEREGKSAAHKIDLVDQFILDVPNSKAFEKIPDRIGAKKQDMLNYLPEFKKKARSNYKNFSDFIDHFKSSFLKREENKSTTTVSRGPKKQGE